jgi:hypothetical protein
MLTDSRRLPLFVFVKFRQRPVVPDSKDPDKKYSQDDEDIGRIISHSHEQHQKKQHASQYAGRSIDLFLKDQWNIIKKDIS